MQRDHCSAHRNGHYRQRARLRPPRSASPGTSNCKTIGHSFIENHRFSGAILHSFCIFNRKFRRKLAFLLQFATVCSRISCKEPDEFIILNKKHSSFLMHNSSFLCYFDTKFLGLNANSHHFRRTTTNSNTSIMKLSIVVSPCLWNPSSPAPGSPASPPADSPGAIAVPVLL